MQKFTEVSIGGVEKPAMLRKSPTMVSGFGKGIAVRRSWSSLIAEPGSCPKTKTGVRVQ